MLCFLQGHFCQELFGSKTMFLMTQRIGFLLQWASDGGGGGADHVPRGEKQQSCPCSLSLSHALLSITVAGQSSA